MPKRTIRVVMRYTKTTKNTFRYDAEVDEPAVSAVYVQKTALSVPPPEAITVVVEY